jgi:hypothetical protein
MPAVSVLLHFTLRSHALQSLLPALPGRGRGASGGVGYESETVQVDGLSTGEAWASCTRLGVPDTRLGAWGPLQVVMSGRQMLVAPEQSADLRRYYAKHTKNDRLDSLMLSRLPLLHPDGLSELGDLGPADPLKRAVRRRVKLVAERLACRQRIDSMLDLLGPAYHDAVGTRLTKTAMRHPRALRRSEASAPSRSPPPDRAGGPQQWRQPGRQLR